MRLTRAQPPERMTVTAVQMSHRSFSRPSGVRLHCGGRRLKIGEQETIISNRSDESTYPEGKSVSRSGATPKSSGRNC